MLVFDGTRGDHTAWMIDTSRSRSSQRLRFFHVSVGVAVTMVTVTIIVVTPTDTNTCALRLQLRCGSQLPDAGLFRSHCGGGWWSFCPVGTPIATRKGRQSNRDRGGGGRRLAAICILPCVWELETRTSEFPSILEASFDKTELKK